MKAPSPPTDWTDAKGQLEPARSSSPKTKNQLENFKLILSQFMNIPYTPNMDVAVNWDIDPAPVLYNATVDQIYQNATKNIASVQAAELHVASAAKRSKVRNRGNLYPNLSLFYALQSN